MKTYVIIVLLMAIMLLWLLCYYVIMVIMLLWLLCYYGYYG